MRGGEARLFRRCGPGKYADKVMTVDLDVLGADQRGERQAVLEGDAGLHRQVLGRDKAWSAVRVPADCPRGIEQRAIDALACLCRHAGIAETVSAGEDSGSASNSSITSGLRLPSASDRLKRGAVARDRLLDEER